MAKATPAEFAEFYRLFGLILGQCREAIRDGAAWDVVAEAAFKAACLLVQENVRDKPWFVYVQNELDCLYAEIETPGGRSKI